MPLKSIPSIEIRFAALIILLPLCMAAPYCNQAAAQDSQRTANVKENDDARASSVAKRISNRSFPSVFQAWNGADNIPTEDRWTTVARHDLVFHAPDFFGLKWSHTHPGLATEFTKESRENALRIRRRLLDTNSNILMLAELRYRDAHRSHLPEEHSWWKRKDGRPVVGWEEGGYWLLDYSNPSYREHIARQAKAIVESQVFDGIMLDWWEDDDDRLQLIQAIRKEIGDDALILVNANDRKTPLTASYVNGYFMECYRSGTVEDWRRIIETLQWSETHLKEPRINCLETWYQTSREDLQRMRAVTTLSLTLSDGYCLFSDPNPLPTPDHLHNWYDFWNRSLGKPKANGHAQEDGTFVREFAKGTAVFNPPDNKAVTLTFKHPVTAISSNSTTVTFTLQPGDGELFLYSSDR